VYEVEAPEQCRAGIARRVEEFLSQASIIVSKEGKQKDIRPGIESIALAQDGNLAAITVTLVDQNELKPRIQDVLAALFGLEKDETLLIRVKRSGLFYREGDAWKSPMEVA
jgi:hypothetical protein